MFLEQRSTPASTASPHTKGTYITKRSSQIRCVVMAIWMNYPLEKTHNHKSYLKCLKVNPLHLSIWPTSQAKF